VFCPLAITPPDLFKINCGVPRLKASLGSTKMPAQREKQKAGLLCHPV
jgi:hypothetical protein